MSARAVRFFSQRIATLAPLMLAFLLVGVLVVSLTGCTAPRKPELVPSAQGVTPVVTVYVYDNAYEPMQVEIEVGQAVRWEFVGPGEHDVVAANGSFVSELLKVGDYVHVFNEPGEFAYDCSIHPEMRGMVTVR